MRRLLCVLLLSALSTIAVCERLSVTVANGGEIPGIDEQGLISEDEELAGVATVKIALNTKNGKVKESANGQVTNQSGESQTFKDPADLDFVNGDDATNIKLLYKVKANGAARLKLSLTVTSQEAIDNLADSIRELGGN